MQFRVTIATNCRELTRSMKVYTVPVKVSGKYAACRKPMQNGVKFSLYLTKH
jgi:rRNA-processing protein FCF1